MEALSRRAPQTLQGPSRIREIDARTRRRTLGGWVAFVELLLPLTAGIVPEMTAPTMAADSRSVPDGPAGSRQTDLTARGQAGR